MLRQSNLVLSVMVVTLAATLVDVQQSEAQGILRRIRSRVQSRAAQPPPTPQRSTTQPNAQRYPSPSAQSRTQLKPVSPVKPGSPTLAAPLGSKAGPVSSSAKQPKAANLTPKANQNPNVNSATFGNSILNQPTPNTKPATSSIQPPQARKTPSMTQPSPSLAQPTLAAPRVPNTTAATKRQSPTPQSPAVTSPTTASRASALVEPKSTGRNLDATPLPSLAAPTPKPSVVAKPVTPDSSRPTLGIEVSENKQGVSGLRVVRFNPGSKCSSAGLKVDDVIVAVNGQPTPNVPAIGKILSSNEVGESVRVRIVRGRTTSALMLPLIDRETANAPATKTVLNLDDLGLDVEEMRGVRGVVVRQVVENSAAAAAGLKPGDRVVAVDGRILITQASLEREVANHQVGDEVPFRIIREGKLVATDLKFVAAGEAQTTEPEAKKPGSMFGGVGAALGGLFGSNDKSEAPETKKAEEQVDDLAFGDEEPVKPVGYESEIQRKLKALQTEDPPSLSEFLQVPAPETVELALPTPVPDTQNGAEKASADAEALRKEIQRLQERLKKIEAAKE